MKLISISLTSLNFDCFDSLVIFTAIDFVSITSLLLCLLSSNLLSSCKIDYGVIRVRCIRFIIVIMLIVVIRGNRLIFVLFLGCRKCIDLCCRNRGRMLSNLLVLVDHFDLYAEY